jgi:RES domain-containing protein
MSLRDQSKSVEEELRLRLMSCRRLEKTFDATVYRATTFRYANQADLVSGEGSQQFGGRWNPPGRFRAVYASLTAETAIAESLRTGRKYGIAASTRTPLVLVAIDVILTRALDLTARQVRSRLGVSNEKMVANDWLAEQLNGLECRSQLVGRLAFEAGVEALIVPSTLRNRRKNLVIFPERLLLNSRLEVVNKEELPRERMR